MDNADRGNIENHANTGRRRFRAAPSGSMGGGYDNPSPDLPWVDGAVDSTLATAVTLAALPSDK
ncbi:MAG: hypothetical protein M1827_004328 [Pycnora praestabilis]|nr:MAG: hypothetical protein M1827_004328 [Pycnora praestabilis]